MNGGAFVVGGGGVARVTRGSLVENAACRVSVDTRRHCGGSRRATWVSMNAAGSPPSSIGETGKDSGDGQLESLAAKDRVALFAQLSPEDTLQCLLDALRDNASGTHGAHSSTPAHADEGIEALYAFANFDVWSVRHDFFGWSMDLGQFERFRRIILARPFSTLLAHSEREVISALHISPSSYVSRVRVLDSSGHTNAVFRFSLSLIERPNRTAHWMVDSLRHELSTSSNAPFLATPTDSSS